MVADRHLLCISYKGPYCNFVLAQHNSISTEPPVAFRRHVGDNDLKSGIWLVKVDSNLVSQHPLVNFDSTEEQGRNNFLFPEEFFLWRHSMLNGDRFTLKTKQNINNTF